MAFVACTPKCTLSLAAAMALLLSACAAVGPNYTGPPKVADDAIERPDFARAELAPATRAPPPARWWESVSDPMLTRLIEDAFAASPTLEAALARLRSALAQQSVNRAALGPTGGATAGYIRGRIPTGSVLPSAGGGSAGGSVSSIPDPIKIDSYSVSSNATWEIDLFGGKRRSIESAGANAEAQQAALQDAQVSLANDMAQAYATLREAQARCALAVSSIALYAQTLELTKQRRVDGSAAQGDVETAEYNLQQARAGLPGLKTQIEQQLDQIALLAGRESGAYDALLAVPDDRQVDSPMPPETTAVGEPADWLRRRPDIRQAERTLASRNATIGTNVANLFPKVSLLGFIGTAGAQPSDLFRGSPISVLMPSLSWNFFDIPANRAKVRGAEADRDESLAEYRRTVLTALQDANDSLSRFGRARETLQLREAARKAAARAAAITRRRYEGGTVSLLDALDADRQRTQADDYWAQARGDLMVAYAGLQKSLGLGWETP